MSQFSSAGTRLRRLVALLGALVLLPLSVVLMAAPAQAAANQLSGSVTDAVGDGLDGVTVTAYVAPDETTVQASTTTNSSGDYTLSPLPQGDYRLKFSKATYRDTWYGDGTDHETVTIDASGDASGDDGPLDGNVVGDQVLTSSLTHNVTGVVTGPGGVPLEGITVSAFLNGDDDEPGVTTTTAAGSGGYTLPLETGIYQIRYSSPTYAGAWYGAGNVASPTATDVSVRTNGAVTVGGTSTGCGGGDPATLCTVSLVAVAAGQTYPIAGRVVDANAASVAGVDVKVKKLSDGSLVAGATTGSNGRYSVDVVAGDYTVEFSAVGWVSTPYQATDSNATATVTVATNGDITTNPAEPLSHNQLRTITLESQPTTYAGTVVSAASGHAALNNIEVRAFPEDDDASQVTAVSHGSGDYELALPVGQYQVQFTDLGGTYLQSWLGGTTHAVVKVAQDGTSRVLTIDGTTATALGEMQLSEPPPDATFPVTGKIEDAIGEGIPGITVTATAQGSGTTAQATTVGDGSYSLALEAGSYRVSAHDGAGNFSDATLTTDGDTPAPTAVTVSGTGVITVDGNPSTGVLSDLALAGTQSFGISGTVTNSSSTPLVGIKVDVYESGDETSPSLTPALSTTAGGAWSTGAVLPIGTYSVKFTGATVGGATYSTTYLPGSNTAKDVAVGQGGKVYVDGVLRTSALGATVMPQVTADTTYPVKGDVTDMVDEPLNKIQVQPIVLSGGGDPTVTAADGSFTLNLKPGTYQLRYSGSKAGGAADDYTTAFYLNDDDQVATIALSPTGEASVIGNDPAVLGGRELSSVSLAGAARWDLSGSVTGSGGTGVSGVKVEARTPDSAVTDAAIGTGITSSTGAFAIGNLPVGFYNLRLVDNDPNDGRTFIASWFGGATKKVLAVGTNGAFKIDDAVQGTRNVGSIPLEEATANRAYPLLGNVLDYAAEALDGADVWVLPAGVTDRNKAVAHVVSGPASALALSKDLGPAGVFEASARAGSYWLRYDKSGFQTTYLLDNDGTGPATITVTADGRITSSNLDLDSDEVIPDVSMMLTPLAFATKPKLTGKVIVGKTVTATFGTLKGRKFTSESVSVEWFLNGKPADDFASGSVSQKFTVPASAATKKLTFRVTVDPTNDDDTYPNAPSVFTSKAVKVPKIPTTLKGVYKKGKLTLILKVTGVAKPTGTLVVKDGKKKIAAIKLKAKNKGKVALALKKLKKGKHKLTLSYAGTKTIAPAKTTLKIKIKK